MGTTSKTQLKPLPAGTPAPEPDEPVVSRVHHEYFVGDAPNDDRQWPWLARVYAENGSATEQTGVADSYDLARNAAYTWCLRAGASLRGE